MEEEEDEEEKEEEEEQEEEEEYCKERWRDAGVSSETAADLWGQRALGPLARDTWGLNHR